MLSFPEEVLLLALDDEKGKVKELPRITLDTAITAAALMELTFLRRLDAGPQKLFVCDTSPVGDPVLDEVLAELSKTSEDKPIAYWISLLTESLTGLEDKVLASLVQKGVLKVENHRILWVFQQRRYPVINNTEITEIKARLRKIIETGELPDPRDAVLISLVHACHLFSEIFSEEELEKHLPQITKLAKFDFVGQALAESISDIEQTICLMNEALYQYT